MARGLRIEGVVIAKRRVQEVRRETARRACMVRVRRSFCIGVRAGDEEEGGSWRDKGSQEMIVLVVCEKARISLLILASLSLSFHFNEG